MRCSLVGVKDEREGEDERGKKKHQKKRETDYHSHRGPGPPDAPKQRVEPRRPQHARRQQKTATSQRRTPLIRTGGLEVEGDQLGPAEPHGQGVVVGGVEALPARVDPGQLEAVVLQELLPLEAVHVLLRLGLWDGRHVPVTGTVCPDHWGGGERGFRLGRGCVAVCASCISALVWI